MSGTQRRAFRPIGVNKTVNLAVTAVNQSLFVPDTMGIRAVRIANIGTQTVFIEFAQSDQTNTATTTTSIPLISNTVEVFTFAYDINSIAAIAAATGSTIYVTYGEGL